ncbi:hypothetical protein [Cytobacillus pseudoceanisediminis]
MEKTCEFYQKALGMEIHRFDEGRNALKFGHPEDKPASKRE